MSAQGSARLDGARLSLLTSNRHYELFMNRSRSFLGVVLSFTKPTAKLNRVYPLSDF